MSKLWKSGLAALLVACGDDRVAGGGGIETNNTIDLVVVDEHGAPVAAARVVARPADWIPGGADAPAPPGFDLSTDADGRVLGLLSEGRWTFEARKGASAILSTLDVEGRSGSATLALAKMARLSGRVALAAGESFAVVSVSGTGHAVRTDATGRWTLDSLPSGVLNLAVSNRAVRDTVKLDPGESDSAPWTGGSDLRALDSNGWVLLDDFTAGRPAIAIAATGASWYMANDRISGGNSTFLRLDGRQDSSWGAFLVAGDPVGSSSFQARFDIDTETQVLGLGYLQVGMSLPEPGQCLDFTNLDTLAIALRGSASVRVEFRSAIHDSLQDYSSYPGILLDPVADAWTTFRIPVDRIVPSSTAGHPDIPWSRAAECVLELRMMVRVDQDLGISDLRLHGVPLENFLYPRVRKP